MILALLSATLLLAPGDAQPASAPPSSLAQVLLAPRATFGLGGLSTGYAYLQGSAVDLFTTQHVNARYCLGGLTLEGGVLSAVPVATAGASYALTGHLRVGWTFSRGFVTAGLSAQVAPGVPAPVQLLPTVNAAWAFDTFGLSAGLFDVHGLDLLRFSFEQERFGVGYVAPLGLEAHARIPLRGPFTLRVQALAFRAFNAQVGLLTVGGGFDLGGALAKEGGR